MTFIACSNTNTLIGDLCLQKLLHAIERAFADCLLLHDENEILLKQNDEKRVRQNAKSNVISQGNANIMSSADFVEAQRKRKAKADAKKTKLPAKRKRKAISEVSATLQEIRAQHTDGLVPPCPGRALVARMW
jgi:hypothetical protein